PWSAHSARSGARRNGPCSPGKAEGRTRVCGLGHAEARVAATRIPVPRVPPDQVRGYPGCGEYIGSMVGYRRNRPVGGTFFFTLTLRDRRSDALVRHVDVLRDAWRRAATRVPHE